MVRSLTVLSGRSTSATPARYRVEHRTGDEIDLLGCLEGVSPHHATLDPFVSCLLRRGLGGELRLVDDATGAVVARRRVRPFRTKAGDRFRQLGD
jgi:hypothetical protein